MAITPTIAWLWLGLTSARAGVQLDDPSACLDAGLLYEELEQRAALPAGAELEVRIEAIGAERVVHMQAGQGGEIVWTRVLDVLEADCAYVHTAVALTVQRGLAALPESTWTASRPLRVWAGLAAGLSTGTATLDPRLRLEGRFLVGRSTRLAGTLRGEAGSWLDLGPGQVQYTSVTLGPGIAQHIPVSEHVALRPMGLVLGGLAISRGRRFETPITDVQPRIMASGGLELAVERWAFGLDLEVPVLRLTFREDRGAALDEPLLRPGLRVSWIPEIRS